MTAPIPRPLGSGPAAAGGTLAHTLGALRRAGLGWLVPLLILPLLAAAALAALRSVGARRRGRRARRAEPSESMIYPLY